MSLWLWDSLLLPPLRATPMWHSNVGCGAGDEDAGFVEPAAELRTGQRWRGAFRCWRRWGSGRADSMLVEVGPYQLESRRLRGRIAVEAEAGVGNGD